METKFKGTQGKWNNKARLYMIEKSEVYTDSARVYQYGFYDGYHKALEDSKAPEMLEMLEKLLIMYKQSDRPSIRLILETEQLIKEATEL